jgi:hypothetical protein
MEFGVAGHSGNAQQGCLFRVGFVQLDELGKILPIEGRVRIFLTLQQKAALEERTPKASGDLLLCLGTWLPGPFPSNVRDWRCTKVA